jgi:starch phosphorylase
VATTTAPSPLEQYECGPLHFSDRADPDFYDRHLVFDHAVAPENASQRERFDAVARSLRDLLTQRWLLTQQTQDRANPKRVYYLSMEFLIGRSLVNNVINLGVADWVRDDLRSDPRQD